MDNNELRNKLAEVLIIVNVNRRDHERTISSGWIFVENVTL